MAKNNNTATINQNKTTSRNAIVGVVLLALLFAGVSVFILVYQSSSSVVFDLNKGDVAPAEILAPNQIAYISNIDTEAARERAKNLIPIQYTPPDPKVARQQVNRLRKIFDYMDTVRADSFASSSEKFNWIDAISVLTLSDTSIDQILIMNEDDWQHTRQEALSILNEAMRTEIKETQVLGTRRQLPTKVALDTPDNQSEVIVDIIADLIQPNTFPDEVRTEAERKIAVDNIEPVNKTIEKNELIIRAGQVIGSKEIESLEALGLQQTRFNWITDLIAPVILMLLVTTILGIYLLQHTPDIIRQSKQMVLLVGLTLTFMAIAKFMIPNSVLLPYLYPIAAFTMMLVILFNAHLAFILTTVLAFLGGYMASENPSQVAIFFLLSGWTGALALGRSQRINALLWAGVYVGLTNTILIIIFNAGETSTSDASSIGLLIMAGLLNGIFSSGLALISLFAIGNLFDITTSIQLLDLARPTQPLLRQLLLKAPGTYHHSLMVSNLAEQAAERIGADSLLVRVMAYYHDIGKMQRPYFFIENKPEGMPNVHERLDPQVSAQIIISHVTDGVDLANKYRLPTTIKNGIAQHHGTSLVKFFYFRATEAASESGTEIDEEKFRYPGPKPQTKETGILMLADVSETTVRALKPRSAAEIDEIVHKAIAHHLDTSQLDDCGLTIADLHNIRTAFVDILQGIHHPRIKYPDQIKAEAEAEARQQAENVTESNSQPSGTTTAKPAPKSIPPSPGPAEFVQQE